MPSTAAKDFELLKVDDPDVIEDNENKVGKRGTRTEFKGEVKKQQAARRLRKEDIGSDLKDTAPAAPKRVPVKRVETQRPKRKAAVKGENPNFKVDDRVTVKYPDKTYQGRVIKTNPKSVVVFFPEDNSEAAFKENQYRLIRKKK